MADPGNPIGGWYGLTKGLRGSFAAFIPPIMVTTPGSHDLAASVLPRLSGKSFLGRFELVQPKAIPSVVNPDAC